MLRALVAQVSKMILENRQLLDLELCGLGLHFPTDMPVGLEVHCLR